MYDNLTITRFVLFIFFLSLVILLPFFFFWFELLASFSWFLLCSLSLTRSPGSFGSIEFHSVQFGSFRIFFGRLNIHLVERFGQPLFGGLLPETWGVHALANHCGCVLR